VYSGDQRFHAGQSAILSQLVRSCTVFAHLSRQGSLLLDLLIGQEAAGSNRFSFVIGTARARISSPTVTYCANPGRPNGQAVVTGTVATSAGPLRKGDAVSLTIKLLSIAHAPEAVIVDSAAKQRLAITGPFSPGSGVKISTP
jgi:hypothetical protein